MPPSQANRARVPFTLTAVLLVAIVIVVLTMGMTGQSGASEDGVFRPLMAEATPATPSEASTPAPSPAMMTPVPTDVSATPEPAALLSADELRRHQPNELGVVPILQYHMITTDPAEEAQFVRLAHKMRGDLEWLHEHNFHIVPLRDVINNDIQVPAGKHPVALTFDDGTSTQFRFIEDDDGELVPDPDTAVGILEAFYEEHPDFGRGGHFAPLIFNAFANPDESQEHLFEQKLHWLTERGYEIGNHTWQHNDLWDMETDRFIEVVAEPMVWMDDVLGDIPENQSRILTLPYGNSPSNEKRPDQRRMMREGIPYDDEVYHLSAALLVGADPAVPPSSTEWDPMWVPRIQAFDESLDFWFGLFESGGIVLYTSDGNPDTIAVPEPLPPSLEGTLDIEGVVKAGKTVIHYDPENGAITATVGPDGATVILSPGRSRNQALAGPIS